MKKGETVNWYAARIVLRCVVGDEEIVDGTEITSLQVEATSPDELVVPKEKLTVVWFEENTHRTAREILEDMKE